MNVLQMFLHSAGVFFLSFGILTIFSEVETVAEIPRHSAPVQVVQKTFLSASFVAEEIFHTVEVLDAKNISITPPPQKECFSQTSFPHHYPYLQSIFEDVADPISCHLVSSLKNVEVFQDPSQKLPRALAGSTIIKIREDAIFRDEFTDVVLHELGHIVDLGGFSGSPDHGKTAFFDGPYPIYANDISVLFYNISWEDSYTKKQNITDFDFVGGYAASDAFEDFAESFLYYIRHGNSFRLLAAGNPILQEKYDFLKIYVFEGKEFETGSNVVDPSVREWDITKV